MRLLRILFSAALLSLVSADIFDVIRGFFGGGKKSSSRPSRPPVSEDAAKVSVTSVTASEISSKLRLRPSWRTSGDSMGHVWRLRLSRGSPQEGHHASPTTWEKAFQEVPRICASQEDGESRQGDPREDGRTSLWSRGHSGTQLLPWFAFFSWNSLQNLPSSGRGIASRTSWRIPPRICRSLLSGQTSEN